MTEATEILERGIDKLVLRLRGLRTIERRPVVVPGYSQVTARIGVLTVHNKKYL